MPRNRPAPSAMLAATAPACSDTRAPQTTRLKTSRPNSSVPMRCAELGASRSMRKSWCTGSYGLTCPAKTASRAKSTRRPAPNIPVPERRKRRRAAAHCDGAARPRPSRGDRIVVALAPATSAVPDARIEHRVHEVDDEADHRHEERDDDDRPLHDRVIARGDRVQHVPSDADATEDRLGEDGAAEQRAELKANDRHDRDERVLQRVAEKDSRLRETLRARGYEGIVGEHLEDARTRE